MWCQVNDLALCAQVLLQPLGQQRAVARGWFALHAEKGHRPRFGSQLFGELPTVKGGESFLAVPGDKHLAQGRALALRHAFRLVGLDLALAQSRSRGQFAEVEVADAKFSKSFLKPGAVGEGVFRPAHAAPPANVAERIHARLLQRIKERRLAETIYANRNEFHPQSVSSFSFSGLHLPAGRNASGK